MTSLKKIPEGAVFETSLRRLRRFSARVGLMGMIAIGSTTTVQAAPLTLQYLVGWGHVTLAEAEISYSRSENLYLLESVGRTLGFLDFFFPWHGKAETKGLIDSGGRRPLHHEHEGTLEEKTRWTRVNWDNAGRPLTEAIPPPDPQTVTMVPEPLMTGTNDPFTAILSLLDHLARSGRCEGIARVWDGRRRYDISVVHLGGEDLVADRPWAYEGPAIRCALDFERIGGFRREAPNWRNEDAREAAQRLIWVAEIGPDQWALVRAELETRYGTVIGRLWTRNDQESTPPWPYLQRNSSLD